MTIHLLSDLEEVSAAAAERWVALAEQSIADYGHFHVALTGGSTPRQLYELLASATFRDRVDWESVHIYFGDERCVPPDHPDSNFRLADEALLSHVPIPHAQIHRLRGEAPDPREAARAYARLLASHLPLTAQGLAQFDLVLLGLGADGHIASLFPGISILHEQTQWVAAAYVDKLNAWRISLTLPVINHARHILMLVSGEAKADILRHAFSAVREPLLPVQLLKPLAEIEWFLDEAAAEQLPKAEL